MKLRKNDLMSSNEMPYQDWLYNIEWVDVPFPLLPNMQLVKQGTWVIFSDDSGMAVALLEKLKSYGFDALEVKSAHCFDQSNPLQLKIRPDVLEDYTQLFKSPMLDKGIAGILYLWGLFPAIAQDPPIQTLTALHKISCGGLLNLVKSLTAHAINTLPKLFVASWSMQEEGDAMALAQWPMSALCKAISMEHPDFKLRQIAFSMKESRQHSVDNLFLELFAKDKEEQITWRAEKRLAPRIIRMELPNIKPLQCDPNGSYLITGGFGPQGLGFAKWYIEHGAKHLVLVDGKAISPEVNQAIAALQSAGATVTCFESTDIGDLTIMQALFDKINQALPSLKGIMHTTELIDDDLLLNLTWARFQPVFNLKVNGAWNLHQLSQTLPLDHFILFSSIGSTLGPLWRANRSAANAFIDALAHYRKTKGLTALTINWGPWAHESTLNSQEFIDSGIPKGLKLLTIEEGIGVLDYLLNLPIPEVVVAPIDWRLLLRRFPVEKPLFINMSREIGMGKSELIDQFQSARSEEHHDIIAKYLAMLVRRVLLLSPTSKLDYTKPFAQMGLTARTLLDLNNQLQYDLIDTVELPFGLIDKNPSIQALTEALYPLLEAQLLKRKQAQYHKLFGNHVGKIALITGGSRGIGEKIAEILIYAGASVALLARSQEQLERVEQDLVTGMSQSGDAHPQTRVFIASCDMSQTQSIAFSFNQALSRFGRIDYLINNAGVSGGEQLIVDMPVDSWRLTLEANLISNYDLMIRALPLMKKQGTGHIINVSSEFGGLRHATPAYPNRADYAVSKAGNRSLAEVFAPLLGPEIQINAVAPGPVQGARLEGGANAPGLYLRRAKLNQENKRLNALYNLLLTAHQTQGNLSEVMNSLAINDMAIIIKDKSIPPLIHAYIHSIFDPKQPEASGSKTHLLTQQLAQRLIKRLILARSLPTSYSEEAFFNVFKSSQNAFFLEEELQINAEAIRKRIVGSLSLGHMPSEDEVAKEIILSLSNKYITGETIYPSCGLSLDRLSTSGDFMGYFYPSLLDALQVKTVMIIGDYHFDLMANAAFAYFQAKQIEHIIVVVGSMSGQQQLHAHLMALGVAPDEINKKISLQCASLDDMDTVLNPLFEKPGFPEIMISFPRSPVPNGSGGWEELPSLQEFKDLIEKQITHHFQIAKRTALIDQCHTFLVTPNLPEKPHRMAFLFARFIQATLASLTITLGDENARLNHQSVVYQLDTNLDLDQCDYSDKLIDAMLVLSLPPKHPPQEQARSKFIKRLGYVVKI